MNTEGKKKYIITLMGCDDYTDIPIELTNLELDLVKRISEKSKEISYISCMPVLLFHEEEG